MRGEAKKEAEEEKNPWHRLISPFKYLEAGKPHTHYEREKLDADKCRPVPLASCMRSTGKLVPVLTFRSACAHATDHGPLGLGTLLQVDDFFESRKLTDLTRLSLFRDS